MNALASLTDAELLLRAQEGDGNAFGALFDRRAPEVLGYFFRRTACAETAADLMAETFAQAFQGRHRFEDLGAPAGAWLFTIARRQLAHYLRRARVADDARSRLAIRPHDGADDSYERIEQLLDLRPALARMTDALEELPTKQREAVRLRVLEGRSFAEVARELGGSEGAARVLVSRALSRLAETMEADP